MDQQVLQIKCLAGAIVLKALQILVKEFRFYLEVSKEPLKHLMRQSKTPTQAWPMGGTQDLEALHVKGLLGDWWHCKKCTFIVKFTLHLENNGEGKTQMQDHCRSPGGRWGPGLSHSCPEMVERGWVDKDLGGRIDRTWDQNDAGIKGSCRSKWHPGCLLEWLMRWQYQHLHHEVPEGKLICRLAAKENKMRSFFDKSRWGIC